MRLSMQMESYKQSIAARQLFRSCDPRKMIYRISPESRKTFRHMIQHARKLVECDLPAPEVILVNTWQAETKYCESNGRDPSYIVFDFQTSNRLTFLSRSSLYNLDAFDTFLNHIGVFLELCIAGRKYRLARRIIEKFDESKDIFAEHWINSFKFPSSENFREENILVDGRAYGDYFLPSFLLGHEIGHHLFCSTKLCDKSLSLLHKAHFKATTTRASNGNYIAKNGFSDGEFVFVNGIAATLRAYRGISENLLDGITRRIERNIIRQRNQEIQEFYCDAVGLILGLSLLNDVGKLDRLQAYWICRYQALISLSFLKYFAFHWAPVHNGAVKFIVPPMYERFAVPLDIVGGNPNFDGLLPKLGWEKSDSQAIITILSDRIQGLLELAELTKDMVYEGIVYEVLCSFGDPRNAENSVANGKFWRDLGGMGYNELFLPYDARSMEVTNFHFGGQMAYKFILETLVEEWRSENKSSTGGTPSQEEMASIERRVIGFRPTWYANVAKYFSKRSPHTVGRQ